LVKDTEHIDSLCRQVAASQLPVMMTLAPRVAAGTVRLRQLLETTLGPPRVLLCDLVQARPASAKGSGRTSSGPLGSAGVALVDWCLSLFGGATPVRSTTTTADSGHFAQLLLEFGENRLARLTRRVAPRARRRLALDIIAERGTARLVYPDRLSWTDEDGRHSHRPVKPTALGRIFLDRFHQALTTGQPVEPSLADAQRALGWAQGGSS
jgi:predicted dehydrogenase